MSEFIAQWKRVLILWLVCIGLFLVASAALYVRGSETIHTIAVQFHDNRVKTMLSQQKYRSAAKELTAWSWLEPERVELIWQATETHLLDRNVLKAFHYLEPVASSMTSDEYDICRLMALIEAERGETSAVNWATRASALGDSKRIVESALVTAHVNRKLGSVAVAREDYSRVLELFSEHAEARYYLAKESEREEILRSFAVALAASGNDFDSFGYTPEFVLKANLLLRN